MLLRKVSARTYLWQAQLHAKSFGDRNVIAVLRLLPVKKIDMPMGPLQVFLGVPPQPTLISKFSLHVLLPLLPLLLLVLLCPPLQAGLPPDFVQLLDFKRQQPLLVQNDDLWSWNESEDLPCGKWQGVYCLSTFQVSELDLPFKHLSGPLPTSLGQLTSLERLNLSNNDLSGPIPAEIVNAKKLRDLDLSRNSLVGNIPSNIRELSNLENLFLFRNSLTGNIPSLQGLTKLHKIDLSRNRLLGPLPDGIASLHNLRHLDLSSNDLTGIIPKDICKGSTLALEFLDLSSNALHGTIPSALLDATNHSLKFLNLSHNSFCGRIPMENGWDYKQLLVLDFSNNLLNGTIPYDLGIKSAWQLEVLRLNGNQITGNIEDLWHAPASRWKSNLREIRLQGNQLNGARFTESTLDYWEGLEVLDLSHNSLLCLDVASMLHALENIREMRLGGMNCVNRSLPVFERSRGLANLEVLDLSSSKMQGEIPSKIFTPEFLPSLRVLNLSNNLLSGAVPAGFGYMGKLSHLDLSGNDLGGPLPDTLPVYLKIITFFWPGNEKLCGNPLPPCDITPSLPSQPSRNTLFTIAVWKLVAAFIAFFVFIVATCGLAWLLSWESPARVRASLEACLSDRSLWRSQVSSTSRHHEARC